MSYPLHFHLLITCGKIIDMQSLFLTDAENLQEYESMNSLRDSTMSKKVLIKKTEENTKQMFLRMLTFVKADKFYPCSASYGQSNEDPRENKTKLWKRVSPPCATFG